MNELVVLQNQQAVTTSLQVAESFEKEAKHVNEVIKNLMVENSAVKTLFHESTYINSRGREYSMYYMNRDGFTLLAMGFTGKKAIEFKLKYIQAFNEMERKLQELNQPSYMIGDPVSRAEKWIEEQKEKQKLEMKIDQDAPFARFGKVVAISDGSINVGIFAKMVYEKHGIELGRKRLFTWLRDNGYLIKQIGAEKNLPKQRYIEQGWFRVKTTIVSRTEGDIQKGTTLITGKGQIALTQILLDEFNPVAKTGDK